MPESGAENRVEGAIGPYLREIRESRGVSLDEAARVTRIGKNYLVAIEEESFDKLPSVAYIKGFLRIYAVYLGLSGDEVVGRYESALAPRPPQPAGEARQSKPERKGDAKARRRGRWFVPFMLLVIVAAIAYLVDDKEERPARVEPPVTRPRVVAAPAPVQPLRTSATARIATAPSPPVPEAKVAPVSAGSEPSTKGIILKLKVTQDSRLNITIDDAISQEYDLKAGDLIEWKGERVFTLDLGNAGGIEAEFNGKPLKPFGERNKPAHVVLKAEGT